MIVRRLLWLLMLCLILPTTAPPARSQGLDRPTLQAEPTAPGGVLAIQGYGFPADTSLELRLAAPALILGTVRTTARGAFSSSRLTVSGRLNPGTYSLEAAAANNPGVALARTSLVIQAAPTITVAPASGPPGSTVQVTLANLAGTAWQVSFGETVVLGPQRRQGIGFSGRFTVPPQAAAGSTPVRLTLLSGDRVLGTATASFQTTAAPAPYQLVDVVVEAADLRPGSTFTIRGRISPVPRGDRSAFSITPIWESAATPISLPVGTGPATIAADGSFKLTARAPHLWQGDPIYAAVEDAINLTLAHNSEGIANLRLEDNFAPFKKYSGFSFAVLRPDGTLVPNLAPANPNEPRPLDVRLEPILATEVKYSDLINDELPEGTLTSAGLLFNMNLKELLYYPLECSDQLLSYNAEAEFKSWEWAVNPWESVRYVNGLNPPALPPTLRIAPGVGRSTLSQADEQPEPVFIFRLYVDASRVIDPPHGPYGYGLTQEVGDQTYALAYERLYLYLPARDESYLIDESTGISTPQPTPVPVQLEALPADTLGSVTIKSFSVGGFTPKSTLKLPDQTIQHALGSVYTFANAQPGINLNGGGMGVTLELNSVGGLVDELSLGAVSVLFDGQPVALTKVAEDDSCGQKSTWARFTGGIAQPWKLPTGMHFFDAFVSGAGGQGKQRLAMKFVNYPEWIHSPALANTTRSLDWSSGGITMTSIAFEPSKTKFELDSNVPHLGDVANDTRIDGTLRESVPHGSPSVGPGGSGTMNSQGMNNPAAPVGFDDENEPQVEPSVGRPIDILDTGKIRVFEVQYGIPAIAYIYLGIDLRIYATTTLNTTLNLDTTSMRVTNNFETGVEVDIVVGAEFLAGIADANFSFGTKFQTNLHSELDPGKLPTPLGECFRARLRVFWEVELFWGAFSVAEGSKLIFKEETGSYCKPEEFYPPPFLNTIEPAQATQRSAFLANPSIATDGFGNTMAVWTSQSGAILSSRHVAGQWTTPMEVAATLVGGSAAIAFYAPNRAVAVWSQSGMPEDAGDLPLPSDPDARARYILARQHLVYSHYNGVFWSAPANLTQPNTGGDGRVALASCPAGDPACPAGGEITAVWVHDAAGSVSQRRFRIQHAALSVNPTTGQIAWGPIANVDANDAVTDTEPAVAYRNGTPVVTWVRDTARKVSPAPLRSADRRLAVRILDGTSPVVLPNVPAGVVDPALIADSAGNLQLAFTVADTDDGIVSNRRALHRAVGTCGGGNSCTWEAQTLRDAKGRTIFAETPALALGANDQISLVFRAMGYDPVTTPLKPLAGLYTIEPPGILLGTGEIGKLSMALDLNAPLGLVDYLTWDPANNAKAGIVFDPVLNSDIVLAVEGINPVMGPQLAGMLSQVERDRSDRLSLTEPVISFSTNRQPNFVLREVGAVRRNTDGTLQIEVEIANTGAAWNGGNTPLRIQARWAGLERAIAGQGSFAALGAGQVSRLTLTLEPPPKLSNNHTLQIELNPGRPIAEQTAADNSRSTTWLALAPPAQLKAAPAGDIAGLVTLSWPQAADERIVGYRIYQIANGVATPVGVSYTGGWADARLAPGATATYAIAAIAADFSESALSASVSVTAGNGVAGTAIYLPLVRR
jgi:hypothetical protein